MKSNFYQVRDPRSFFLCVFWSKFKIVQKCLFLEIFTKEFFGKFLIFKFSNCKNKQKLSKPEFHCSEKLWAQKKEIDGKRERERERERKRKKREREIGLVCVASLPGNWHSRCYWRKFSCECLFPRSLGPFIFSERSGLANWAGL